MHPIFFGEKESQLYGVYHEPTETVASKKAVLICYPLFHEYIKTHRATVQLAQKLAKQGCHVLRFDYNGTGDSAGELTEASVTKWVDNIKLAEKELTEISGVRKISIVGIRLGSLLTTLHDSKKIQNIVLWDPVTKGKNYLQEMSDIHLDMLVDMDRFSSERNHITTPNMTELVGFNIPNHLYDDIKNIEINMDDANSYEKILLLSTEENAEYKTLNSKITETNSHHEWAFTLDKNNSNSWNEVSKIEDVILANDIIEKISEFLT